ncbi:MAG: hypothetical protein KDC83_07160 [Flavobacteriales bacterium]|nr:hypothetical protein [Flavobacteriales bacterium]
MEFSKGQIVFMTLFILVFVLGIGWSYWRDRSITNRYYKGSYKVIIYIIAILGTLYLLVKTLG